MSELLKVSSLRAGYARRTVLRDVSFSLCGGEICAVLGKNGCGKTTLLRAVADLIPAQGSRLLDGREIGEMSARERALRIAYLSAHGGEPLPMTALDVVLTGCYPLLGALRRITRAQQNRAMEALALLGVSELAERDFATLSGGQRQLTLLARTLLRDTRLMLLDEPESALDFNRRREVMRLLCNRARESGCGILLCSHDVNTALRHADRILTLRDGHISADLRLNETDEEALRSALSEIYGDIGLIRHGGAWLMTEE